MMRKLNVTAGVTAAIGVILGSGMASAADLAPQGYYTKAPAVVVAAYDWSGFYIGANGGWGQERTCETLTNGALGVPVAPARAGCSSGSGAVLGGQYGYRWQTGAFVFGAEAQGDWSNLKGANVSQVNPLVTNQTKIEGLGLFTGQVGYAWNNALFYAKGGAAVVADKYNGLSSATGIVVNQTSETRIGGVAGAGIEYGFTRNWSVALEYDHLFMGNDNKTFISTGMGAGNLVPAGGISRAMNIGQNADMVTARINYRFGGPVVPRY
jgi:outer membrane immunogenic protein